MTERRPNLLIAGAPKCGTSTLHAYLAQQREVCAAEKKELHYFTPLTWGDAPVPFEEYMAHFRRCGDQRYVLESSPEYLYGGSAIAAAVRASLGDARIIFVLREPVQRLYSQFRHLQKNMRIEQLTFAAFAGKALQGYADLEHSPRELSRDVYARCVRAGCYAPFLEQWYATYDPSRMTILFYDDLCSHPHALLRELLQWLDLESAEADAKLDVLNKGELIRWRTVHRHARRVYRALRPLLNRSRGLKETLRGLYQRVNTLGDPHWQGTPEAQTLRAFYEPRNRALRDLLLRLGHRRLPEWLGATIEAQGAAVTGRAVRS